MTYNVVHISLTPLAGAPIRIVGALNRYTDFNARNINFNPNQYGARIFPEDLIWQKDKNECLEIISSADILHFHHFIDIESENNPFAINFKKINPKAKVVRHFHSELNFLAKNGCSRVDILNDKYPKLVIPHSPERTFLDAFVVPNIIPINDVVLIPNKTNNDKPKVFFSASSENSMWCARWDTKGLPEVKNKFKNLKKEIDFDFQIIVNTPYIECQKIKQLSDIVIGDTTSGSYHLTDLEALAMGKPTFTYLDNRSQFVLENLLKCDGLPFINSRLEEIDLAFIEIVKNKSLRNEIGEYSRFWIEKYYNDKDLVKFYIEAYGKLLNNEPLLRQENLDFPNAKIFLYNDLYNMQWLSRKEKLKKKTFKQVFYKFMHSITFGKIKKFYAKKLKGYYELY